MLLDLWGGDIKPIAEKLPDIFLKKINSLLQFKRLFQFNDDLVKRVEVIGVIAAIAGKMHDS